ncbi:MULTISPECIES: hypothetical protein [Campylobacter]|uniref:Uncharacterized protein n=3 Tax=Campylobacter TaxID=194 RepID=A0A6L5WI12_9BACT|nr:MULTISPECIES: hypothetical protein [Campylobacter]OCS16488.1 hypothetical protein CfvWBT01109_02770 [Campylobacter fetus subsp. venerealis]EAI8859294.1 hypothetical protein [Campylobacter fetus]EGK8193104.1 hypothetical protein [Campylobacter fetus]MSN96898.1 hypothetical protein [Campylobacter portucalensis]QMS68032.1 hypothetical protein GZ984_006065 [Campylobacter fetus]
MGILDKKKEFAFVNNASVTASSNVSEFINSGAADKKEDRKSNAGRPRKEGEKPVAVAIYLMPSEKERLENEAKEQFMSLSGYLKQKLLA